MAILQESSVLANFTWHYRVATVAIELLEDLYIRRCTSLTQSQQRQGGMMATQHYGYITREEMP